jgi:hypothetical protein
MATFAITQLDALRTALALVETVSDGDTAALAEFDPAILADTRAVLRHKVVQKGKPAQKPRVLSKNTFQNMGFAREVAIMVWDMAPMTVTDSEGVSETVPAMVSSKDLVTRFGRQEVSSTQKMSAILKHALEAGWLVRVEQKSKVLWQRGEVDPRA